MKQETSSCIWDSPSSTQACVTAQDKLNPPSLHPTQNAQNEDVHNGSLIIHTWEEKKAIKASQRAQRTSKATLNPKLYFSPGSTQENKQDLDASVSKSLFTLLWWRALKRVLLCSVIGLRAKKNKTKKQKKKGKWKSSRHRINCTPIGQGFGAFDRSFSTLPGSSCTICLHSHWGPSNSMSG